MQFDKTYWTAMDKEAAQQYLVNPKYLGTPTPPFEKQLNALQAKIFEGVSAVELGFMGTGKGSVMQGKITPEMHSREEREEMRQLAKLNKISLSTHAAPAGSLAGFSQNKFSDQARNSTLNEIKRAVEFAADVAESGPIVVHVGEFPRPIHGTEMKGEKSLFTGYPEEEKEKVHLLVNERTGEIFKSAKEDESIWVPEIEKKDGKEQYWEGVKAYNPLTQKDEEIPKYVVNPNSGDIKVKEVKYSDFKKDKISENIDEKEIPKQFLHEAMKAQIEHQLGNAHEYELRYQMKKEDRDKYYQAMKHWEEIEKKLTPEEVKKLKHRDTESKIAAERYNIDLGEKTASEALKEVVRAADKEMRYAENAAISARKQAEELGKKIREAVDIEDFTLKKTAQTVADAAMYAYEIQKKRGQKEPLFIAPENIFPEEYGAHPDELKKIVKSSRDAMVEKLKKNMSEEEAKKVAEDHIRATFDIGHVNTWKKYFSGTDEEFNKWVVDKARDLVKNKIIGHVHLTDNFGYEDEHLAPGEGNAPILDFVKEIRKEGYKGKMIVEVGSQDKGRAHEALLTAMRHFNSPVYRIDGASMSWTDVEHSYFGKVLAGPSYVVGAYAPDIDIPTEHRTWVPWSGVPLE